MLNFESRTNTLGVIIILLWEWPHAGNDRGISPGDFPTLPPVISRHSPRPLTSFWLATKADAWLHFDFLGLYNRNYLFLYLLYYICISRAGVITENLWDSYPRAWGCQDTIWTSLKWRTNYCSVNTSVIVAPWRWEMLCSLHVATGCVRRALISYSPSSEFCTVAVAGRVGGVGWVWGYAQILFRFLVLLWSRLWGKGSMSLLFKLP